MRFRPAHSYKIVGCRNWDKRKKKNRENVLLPEKKKLNGQKSQRADMVSRRAQKHNHFYEYNYI